MMFNRFTCFFAFFLFSLFSFGIQKNQKLNFIIVFVDDMGYGDLGVFGNPTISTPNLDKMAYEGQKWTQFYSASSVLNLQDANNGCVLYIGSTGDVMVDTIAGSTATRKVLFPSVPVGFFPIQVTKVYEEGTTASKIVAIW